jgi:hypothetical protein
VIEQRASAMLGDDGSASLSEIFAQAGVPRSAFATGLHANAEAPRMQKHLQELVRNEATT